ncbi:MAG: DUF4382 domain-containing protein [Nitrospirae bacterium]|nr:DUF4382 domain-containing protein [Nitrospirota bacterium]
MALVNLPAGTYHKVRFELDTASGSNYFCTGTGIEPCTAPDRYDLTVPSGKVDLELHPNLIVEAGSSTNLIFDFVPDKSIHITATGNSRYLLRPEIHIGMMGTGFAGGFSGEFQDDEMDLEEFRGTIASIQCAPTPSMVLSHPIGNGTLQVDLSQAALYDTSGNIISCEDLAVDLRVKVKGTLQGDGTLLAEIVKLKPADARENGDGSDHRGVINNLQVTDTGATFDLLVGGGVLSYQVQVGLETEIIDERSMDLDLSAGLETLSNGERVDVEGDLNVESATIVATGIEIKE